MARMRTAANSLGAAALAIALAGCGALGIGQSDPGTNYFYVLSSSEIYKRGEFELENNNRPKQAVRYFGEVERLYPYSEWAKRGLIMQAYAYHKGKNYEEARGAAQRFIDTYPGDQDAAYAKYLLALSYYDQIDEVGRDQGLTFQALQALREVIENFVAETGSARGRDILSDFSSHVRHFWLVKPKGASLADLLDASYRRPAWRTAGEIPLCPAV